MGGLGMSLGQNFPVSEYYKGRIIDAETIARGGSWWTAVLVIKDPQTEKPYLGYYRWQWDGENWKTRKTITFKSKRQVEEILASVSRLKEHLE